jgi:hypothetical protein
MVTLHFNILGVSQTSSTTAVPFYMPTSNISGPISPHSHKHLLML